MCLLYESDVIIQAGYSNPIMSAEWCCKSEIADTVILQNIRCFGYGNHCCVEHKGGPSEEVNSAKAGTEQRTISGNADSCYCQRYLCTYRQDLCLV